MKEHGSYINGSWVIPKGVSFRENVNQSDRVDIIGHYVQSPNSLVDDAVSAAREALPSVLRLKFSG